MNCPKCEKEIEEESKFCSECGEPLVLSQSDTKTKLSIDDTEEENSNLIGFSAVTIVIILIFLIAYSSNFFKQTTNTFASTTPVATTQKNNPSSSNNGLSTDTQTNGIPGLTVENIYSVLGSAGFDEYKDNNETSGVIDDKVNGEYVSINISTPSDKSDNVSSVTFSMWSEPNISPTIGGMLPHNPTIDSFFPKVASVSYDGADPTKAYTWAWDQFNNGTPQSMPTETVIGPAHYQFNIQSFGLELIYSLKISASESK